MEIGFQVLVPFCTPLHKIILHSVWFTIIYQIKYFTISKEIPSFVLTSFVRYLTSNWRKTHEYCDHGWLNKFLKNPCLCMFNDNFQKIGYVCNKNFFKIYYRQCFGYIYDNNKKFAEIVLVINAMIFHFAD